LADILLDIQAEPSTPASGKATIFFDTTSKLLTYKNADAKLSQLGLANAAVAAQGAGFSSDTYVTNSGILIPSWGMKAKMVFRWTISASKSAAGTAQPVYTVRIGANQSTGDTARLQLTGAAQTAAADVGVLTLIVTVRTVSATGVIQGTALWNHNGAAAGFADNDAGAVEGTSAGFDNSALGGSFIGLSIDGGASAAWTLTQVIAELLS
jgi:hypothetical protein